MKKVAYEDYRAMDYEEKRTVACLDMSGCDFRHIYVCKTLRFAENLQEVILSDTVLDPAFQVNCMGGGGTFADDEGVLCRWGEGSTPSHAYENRAPVALASDRERRAYPGLSDSVKMRIVPTRDKNRSLPHDMWQARFLFT